MLDESHTFGATHARMRPSAPQSSRCGSIGTVPVWPVGSEAGAGEGKAQRGDAQPAVGGSHALAVPARGRGAAPHTSPPAPRASVPRVVELRVPGRPG